MSTRNRDHVAIYTSRETLYWAFVIPSEATTCSEQAAEMVDRCTELFESFRDFVRPRELTYPIHVFPDGHTLPASAKSGERVDTLERHLRNEDGITAEEFLDSTKTEQSGARWIPIVEFDRLAVKVHLTAGEVYADREHHCVEYAAGEPLDRAPTWDPLKVSLAHHPNQSHPSIDTDFVTSVTLAPRTDIWFEDTDIGAANRRELTAFFERVEQTLPVATVDRTSDWYPIEDLKTVF